MCEVGEKVNSIIFNTLGCSFLQLVQAQLHQNSGFDSVGVNGFKLHMSKRVELWRQAVGMRGDNVI